MNINESDAAKGMAWWNGLTDLERAQWMERAGDTGVAADAWESYKNYDGAPYCQYCGALTRKACDCGPIAANN